MIEFWELAPSPNNTKVRMALRLKGLDFETIAVDPMDRAPLREVSGQDNAPIVRANGVVLNDSEAILQLLDANYPDGPRLFPRDKPGRRSCDDWKAQLDERIARPWAPVFFYGIGRREDLDENARAEFTEGLSWIEEELDQRDSFDEGDAAVNDLRVAEWATYALPGDGLIERCRLFRKFREHFGVEAGRFPRLERFLEPWNERLA